LAACAAEARTLAVVAGAFGKQSRRAVLRSGKVGETFVIEKCVKKASLSEHCEVQENLTYWLSKTPEERVAAVEILRRQYPGGTKRIERVACVVVRPGLTPPSSSP
jgi:hypothetical protein